MADTAQRDTKEAIQKSFDAGTVRPYTEFWAAVVFWLHLAAFIGLFAFLGSKILNNPDFGTWGEAIISICSISCVIAAGLSVIWIGIMRLFHQHIVWFSLIAWPAILIGWGVYFITQDSTANGIINFLVAAYFLLFVYLVRSKVPFATAVLSAATLALKDVGGAVGIHIAGVFLNVGWTIFYIFLWVFFILPDWLDGLGMDWFPAIVIVWTSYSFTSSFISNVTHVTTCGSISSWWMLPTVTAPTGVALKRALTTSSGTIALGSFIVAMIDMLRTILEILFNNVCLRWLFNAFKQMVQYLSAYAFVHVAIYGEGFIDSTRSMFSLFKSNGVSILVNDVLTSRALRVGAYLVGLITGGIAVGMARGGMFTGYGTSYDVFIDLFFLFICYLIGKSIGNSALDVVFSAIITTYVLFASDPATMLANRPDVYNSILASTAVFATESNYQQLQKLQNPGAAEGQPQQGQVVVLVAQPVQQGLPIAQPVSQPPQYQPQQ